MHPSPSDRFNAACGLAPPLEIEVCHPDREPARHSLDGPAVVVGSAARSTLCLDEVTVSQRHAFLQVLGGRLFALDLDGRGGIRIDGAPARGGWVDPGQVLGVGPFEIRRLDAPPPEAPLVSDPLDERLPVNGTYPLAWFDIFEGNLHVARWRLNRVLSLVGRSTRCRVRLPDVSVSGVHCVVVATPTGVWVVDLLSREGTRLRGEPIQLARLDEGDLLEVGNYRLRITFQSGQHRTVPAASAAPTETTPRSLRGMPPMNRSTPPPVVVVRDDPGTGLVAAGGPGGEGQFLLPLMQQFGAMQQEMFDQFQRTMMMVVQAFSTMHQEQAALLREEMQQFRKVTEELQAAHKELRERQAAAAPAPTPTPAPTSTPAPAPPRPEPPRAAARPFPSGQRPLGSWEVGQAEAPVPPPPVGAAAAAEELGIGGPAPAEGDEVHDWLSDRIANLERERQSRWQRILSFMRSS